MWMSTSKQVLHPPINGTSDEHFRLKSFSDPRLPDDKGAGLDKRDPQVKCEQRGGMGSRMAHETADYSRVVVQPSQEKIASRPKSSQHYSHNPRVARPGGYRFRHLQCLGVHRGGILKRPSGSAGLISNASIFAAASGRSLPLNDTLYAVGIVMPSTVA